MPRPLHKARFLEQALLATWILHGLAMLAMVALLLPMMPGGPTPLDADRIALIAAHPWRFRAGWLPWQLTALSDLALAVALLRTPGIPRRAAWVVLLLTVAAIVPDQGAQLVWVTRGVELSRQALASGDPSAYLAIEALLFRLTGVYAALLYTLAAIGWMACFVGAGLWNRALSIFSALTILVFAVVTIGPLLPSPLTLPGPAIAAGNALGFVLLMIWLALQLEVVLRHARPQPAHGRWAAWRAPAPGFFGRVMEMLANSQLVRRLCLVLPVFDFRSDITEVVYVNYLVDAQRLEPFVPEGLSLQRIGPAGRYAVFSFLTYRHGHFGPRFLGPLRRLFGSPVQSNWRTYVRDDRTGHAGIYFVTNAVTTLLHALGARLLTEGMPMHLLRQGEVSRAASDDGKIHVRLDPGTGSAPDAELQLAPAARILPEAWAQCFADYDAMLRYVVPQDRALSTLPLDGKTVRQEIDLGIPLTVCEPLTGEVRSRAVAAIVGDAVALCFRVPAVAFHFNGERHDPWP